MPFNDLGSLVGGSIGGLAGGIGSLLGLGAEDWEDEYKRALQFIASVQTPEYNQREIAPAQLGMVGEYQPQIYDAQIQGQPQQVAGSPDMRAQQVATLEGLADYTGRDLPLSDALATQDIQRRVGQDSQALTQAAIEAMAMQGNLGGGQEAVLRSAGNQQAMELARGMGSDLTQQAIQARLQALGMGAGISGQVRGQDLQEQGRNADALNRFNEWASQLSTQVAGRNAATRQGALDQTLAERQRIADWNKMNVQGTQTSNVDRQNALLQQSFSDDFSKAQAQAQAATGYGGALWKKEHDTQKNLINIGRSGGGLGGGLLPWGT
jgi:hypothetical protein